METLILREGGTPIVAPSVQEKAFEDDSTAIRFIEDLEAGAYDAVICMTGVGLTFLRDMLVKRMSPERIGAALRKASIISRGPKPVGILRELGVPVDLIIPEPNSWREIVTAVASRSERRLAVQEYGRPNGQMNAALEALGATVTPVALYRWELPDDVTPLENAVHDIADGRIDVILFTSSIQFDHLMEIAERLELAESVRNRFQRHIMIGSVGPVMSDWLAANGVPPDVAPRHPKMWALVKAASEQAHAAIASKRGGVSMPGDNGAPARSAH